MKTATKSPDPARSRRFAEHSSFQRFSFQHFSSTLTPLFPRDPHFPAFRASPTAVSRASRQKRLPSSGEKNTQWECGYRVPTLIKWPGTIKPGTIVNEIGDHEDMRATLVAAVGDATAKEDLLKVRKIGDATYKVHLDGYNLGPALKGEGEWPHKEFIYWTDDGKWLQSIRGFPPRQKPGSFNLDRVMEAVTSGSKQ